LLPVSTDYDPSAEAEFNRLSIAEYEQIRDFIILHYVAQQRPEEFWRACRSLPMPDSLAHRMELFRMRGKVARHDGQLFSDSSWIAVMLGQHVTPRHWDPLAETLPLPELESKARELREGLHRAIARMPTHAQFIEHNCRAP
jgi:tryptophan halogenase